MKLSQNQYAETFMKTLGARAGTPTFDAGRQVIADVIHGWGIESTQVLQADGSGLSRYDMVTAEALAGVLTHVAQDPRLDGPFKASLVVAGMPGMMANRLKGTAAASKVQAKTGAMRHVRSTSGYTQTADGEPVVFSIIANNFGISSADVDRTADAVILKVFEFTR
jgi:D-alanyl-D-alanine carboxypeptidase/D-alanyl-D-alanine-endopeptidase (penicillin-binding protein 4)